MKQFRFTITSRNRKTGPIPVTLTEKLSCPDSCPLKANNTCYAKLGQINIHWMNPLLTVKEFILKIKSLPAGQLWRHNEAGDLLHNKGKIDFSFVKELVKANKFKRGFAYTHHLPNVGNNADILAYANNNGFTVNISSDNVDRAVELREQYPYLPLVTIIPSNSNFKKFSYKGNKFVVCPNTLNPDKIKCFNCGLCQKANRDCIVAFPAHGVKKNTLNAQLEKGEK